MHVKNLLNNGVSVMQGNLACAEGAIAAGCNFFAGYPITPATEIAEHMSKRLMETGGYFVQMEDELGSINALIGASLAGGKAMTATSGPGYSLMQEGIGLAVQLERPVVICDVMRGGPSSGQATNSSQGDVMQVKYGSHGDYEIAVLCPASVQEAFDMTVRAFSLANKYYMPVIVLMDEIIAHMREKATIPETVEVFDEKYVGDRVKSYEPDDNLVPPRISCFEGQQVYFDGCLHDYDGYRAGGNFKIAAQNILHLRDKLLKNIDDITSVQAQYDNENVDVAVIAYGSVSRASSTAVENARNHGLRVSHMKLDTLWPVPEKQIKEFASRAKKVLVPEMNTGKYVREIQRLLGLNRVEGLMSLGGELHHPDVIENKIKEMCLE